MGNRAVGFIPIRWMLQIGFAEGTWHLLPNAAGWRRPPGLENSKTQDSP